MVLVAAAQLRLDDDDVFAQRVERIRDLLTGTRPDLLVLPELWPVGAFDLDRILAGAQPLDGPYTAAISRLAIDLGATVHGGSFPERHDHGISNTSVVVGPDGRVLASYRKMHLFGFDAGEAVALTAGTHLVQVPTPLGPTGLATCYDLRFPGVFRGLSRAGVQAYVVPSGWPAARVTHWSLLSRARALENQALLVGCNSVGISGGVPMGGASVIVGPGGEVLAEAGTGEVLLLAEVDPRLPERARRDFPVLRDRRID